MLKVTYGLTVNPKIIDHAIRFEPMIKTISSLKVAMIKPISRSWKTKRGLDIDSIHPPFEPVSVDGGIFASPIKLFATGLKKTPRVEHLGQIIEQ